VRPHHEGTKGTKDTKAAALVVSHAVVGAAIEVHRHLGPGLLESVYENGAMPRAMATRFTSGSAGSVSVSYKGAELDAKLRLDLLVDVSVIVEVKSVDRLAPIHRAQVLTHLRLTNYPVGLLINFNVELLKHGIRRVLFG
jgi:GxxExxY protein